jgi:uncharacterized protein
MILAIPAALLILVLVVTPQLWIMSVMRRHAANRPEIPWTGGEFARHLLDRMKLTAVKVEETERGDHYHPLAKSVRLSAEHFHGRSLTAVVIVQKAGALLIIASPAIAALLRHPGGLVLGLVAAILVNLTAVAMHAVTLPVEFDSSFNRALGVLEHGRFIPEEEMGAARHILSAAAFTYVAGALIDLINLPRLLNGLRM